MCLLGSKHQCRSEEGSNAGCPSDGEDHAEQKCREEPHIIGIYRAVTSSEQIQLKHTQEIQSKGNDDQTGNNVDCRLIFPENTADRSCQRTEGYKYNREAGNKSQCPFQGLAGGSFTATGKLGNIDREHRKQTRGYEGNDAFQKRDHILHPPSHSFPITPESSQPISPI